MTSKIVLLAALLATETERWGRYVKLAKIQPM